jgi:hypothetical protein
MERHPRGCPASVHEAIKADPARWEAETIRRGYQGTGARRLDVRLCRVCTGSISKRAPSVLVMPRGVRL